MHSPSPSLLGTQRCMGVREKMPTHDHAIKSQTDRNLKLTGTLRNTSRFLENSTAMKS